MILLRNLSELFIYVKHNLHSFYVFIYVDADYYHVEHFYKFFVPNLKKVVCAQSRLLNDV